MVASTVGGPLHLLVRTFGLCTPDVLGSAVARAVLYSVMLLCKGRRSLTVCLPSYTTKAWLKLHNLQTALSKECILQFARSICQKLF